MTRKNGNPNGTAPKSTKKRPADQARLWLDGKRRTPRVTNEARAKMEAFFDGRLDVPTQEEFQAFWEKLRKGDNAVSTHMRWVHRLRYDDYDRLADLLDRYEPWLGKQFAEPRRAGPDKATVTLARCLAVTLAKLRLLEPRDVLLQRAQEDLQAAFPEVTR